MRKRTSALLITLVWACAVALGVLPWVWPAFSHVLGNRLLQHYEAISTGAVLGWLTKDVLDRRKRPVTAVQTAEPSPGSDPPGRS